MKKLLTYLFGVSLLLTACQGNDGLPGPQGPPGRDGLDGRDGQDGLFGAVFEISGDFTPENNYVISTGYPNNLEVLESDVVMVYMLVDNRNNQDVWEPLPRTIFPGGPDIVYYGFEFSISEVNIFIDANFDVNDLTPVETDGFIFRIAVLPAYQAKQLNLNNYSEVMGVIKQRL